MGAFDLTQMFDDLKKKEAKKLNDKANKKFNTDDSFIEFKSGNTYKLRLLFHVPAGSQRKMPFINRYTHTFWDDTRSNNKLQEIVCPTSEYISDGAGFKECEVCGETSKFYKEKEKGSASAKALYETFRRKFNGFAIAYVVSCPSNKDYEGKVKVMRYGVTINRFLKKEIFGVDLTNNQMVTEDTIGINAFRLEDGYDMIIAVGTKKADGKDYNTYDCSFARKPSKVSITEAEIAEQVQALKFDDRFFTHSTKEEIFEFKKKYILGSEEDVEAKPAPTAAPVDELDEIPMGNAPKSAPVVEKKESAPAAAPKAAAAAEDDIDIDKILNDVKDGKF